MHKFVTVVYGFDCRENFFISLAEIPMVIGSDEAVKVQVDVVRVVGAGRKVNASLEVVEFARRLQTEILLFDHRCLIVIKDHDHSRDRVFIPSGETSFQLAALNLPECQSWTTFD